MPKMEENKKNAKKEELIQALEKNLGIVTNACNATRISRSAFYKWYNNDPEFKQRVDSINDIVIDFVETNFYRKIRDEQDTAAMIFFLKSKGKKRGWNEKSHIEFSGALGLMLPAEEEKIYDEADAEKLRQMKEILEKK